MPGLPRRVLFASRPCTSDFTQLRGRLTADFWAGWNPPKIVEERQRERGRITVYRDGQGLQYCKTALGTWTSHHTVRSGEQQGFFQVALGLMRLQDHGANACGRLCRKKHGKTGSGKSGEAKKDLGEWDCPHCPSFCNLSFRAPDACMHDEQGRQGFAPCGAPSPSPKYESFSSLYKLFSSTIVPSLNVDACAQPATARLGYQ